MLASRISIPDQVPGMTPEAVQLLKERVAAANEILREEADKLADHTIDAEWKPSPVDPRGRVDLILSLGDVRFTHQISLEELSEPTKIRQRLRDELWYLVATYVMYNQRDITRLLKEIKQDRVAAGT